MRADWAIGPWSLADPGCRPGKQTCGDGGPATAATLGLVHNIDVGPDGSLYALTGAPAKIRRIGGDGIMRTVVDFAALAFGQGLAVAADETIYYSFFGLGGREVYRLTPEGHKSVLAGTGRPGFGGDGGPPSAATFEAIASVALDPEGRLYVFDGNDYRVRRIEPALPGFAPGEIVVSAEDGEAVYAFSPSGRHLRTVHPLNGATRHRFGYDDERRLLTITDVDGDVTTIERDGQGNPSAIVSPDGQRTCWP